MTPKTIGNEKNRTISFTHSKLKKFVVYVLAPTVFISSFVFIHWRKVYHQNGTSTQVKLHWFIPDGLRAEPHIFQIYRWAEEGKLPNIRRMMAEGSYGYSIPVFPSHTPVNFASLFTGKLPIHHGVADGPIRQWGYPLSFISNSGFRSLAKSIDPFWVILDKAGLVTSLLSIPGSTPPETAHGNVVKGRWGGWGVEFPSIVFHSAIDSKLQNTIGWNDRVFGNEKKLTEFVQATEPTGWNAALVRSFSPRREINLRNWSADLFVLISDSTDDEIENYDTLTFSLDKRSIIQTIKKGEWSRWFEVDLSYETGRFYQKDMPQRLRIDQLMSELKFKTAIRIKGIELGRKDAFRIRVLYDGLNRSLAVPQELNEKLLRFAGPMVDFVDNYPPQLIYVPDDKSTFLEEAEMSFTWHQAAARFFRREVHQDVFLHSIYTPNQMLTSRWWMQSLDPRAKHYSRGSEDDRKAAWSEVLAMYKRVDDILGDALSSMSPGSYLVFSSDHGAVPLNEEVRLNNLFARKGWLRFEKDEITHKVEIDWKRSKVVYLNMNHIYVHTKGFGRPYYPDSGGEYEKMRAEVSQLVRDLKNSSGNSPLAGLIERERAHEWGLPKNRVGDLILANEVGFNWVEDLSDDLEVFAESLKGGYKQATLPDKEEGLWTPFIIVGPHVKKGHQLSRPISHLEQLPTILKLMKISSPYQMDREPLDEIIQ